MFLPIVVAIFLGAWGFPPSLQPQPAQGVQEKQKPTEQNISPNPLVDEQQSKSDQRPEEKEYEKTSEGNFLRKCFQFVREYNAEIVTISTVVMAVFTVGLFISTHLLWKSGEKHSERELRAYVGVTEIGLKGFGISQIPSAVITIKNSGQTPAYEMMIERTFDIGKIPREEFLPYPTTVNPERSRSTIWPGVEVESGGSSPRAFNKEEIDAVISKENALFFFGRIDYMDAFKKKRFTNFRYQTRLRTDGVLEWQVCEEGNDST